MGIQHVFVRKSQRVLEGVFLPENLSLLLFWPHCGLLQASPGRYRFIDVSGNLQILPKRNLRHNGVVFTR